MFFMLRFMIVWTIWIIFADKKRWRELLPVGIFGAFLGSVTDSIMHYYPLWKYKGVHPIIGEVLDDWGIYIVTIYLFLQWLPRKKSMLRLLAYWFLWTGIAITIEYIHIATGHMEHLKWWNLGYSYLADWLLFTLFYLFHKVFRFNYLSDSNLENIPYYKNHLEQNKEKLDLLADTVNSLLRDANVVMLSGNFDEDTIYCSDNVYDLIGIPAKAFLENPKLWYQVIYKEDLPIVDSIRSKLKLLNRKKIRLVHRVVRYDGEIRWVETEVIPVVNEHGHIKRFDCVVRDVTNHQTELRHSRIIEEE